MNPLWIGLAGGAGACAHCLGMCGGFALHLSRAGGPGRVLGRQLAWHAGKTCTYTFLGAVAGFGGGWVRSLAGLGRLQDALAYAAGGVMILMGLVLMGALPAFASSRDNGQEKGILAAVFRSFFQQPTAGGALALGLATGFLPCPIVLAFLAYSAQTGSVAAGMVTMAAMGVGTAWSLLALGMTGHLIGARFRRWGAAAGGILLLLLGVVTLLRGTTALHRVLGCPKGEAGASCCEKALGE